MKEDNSPNVSLKQIVNYQGSLFKKKENYFERVLKVHEIRVLLGNQKFYYLGKKYGKIYFYYGCS